MAMDDYNPVDLLNEKAILFVCATAGQGDEPENMKKFWKFLLRKSLPLDSLISVNFSVLALGDSSFSKFNWVGKKVNKRLLQLGGQQIIPLGLCDDQHDMGISAVYIPFIKDFFQKLRELYPMPDGIENKTFCRQYKFNVRALEFGQAETELIWESLEAITVVDVLENKRTTDTSHFQDVRYIKMDCKGLKWMPGDVVSIRAHNSENNLTKLFDIFKEHRLNMNRSTVISITEIDEGEF